MKKNDILVLNRVWVPLHIIEWKKAMSLIYTENARPLSKDFISYTYSDWLDFSIRNAEEYNKISTSNYKIAIPEIIVLTNYDNIPKREIKYSRQTVFERDRFICQYCGIEFPIKELTIDHVVPRSKGGKSTWDNSVSCCKKCNHDKSDRTLAQAGMKLIHKPIHPSWVSPMTKLSAKVHTCKSWNHFMDRVNGKQTEEI